MNEVPESTIESLTDAQWEFAEPGFRLRLDDPSYRFTRRGYGGYNVEFEGERLGWVIKIDGGWDAYKPRPESVLAERICWGAATRRDAVQDLAMAYTYPIVSARRRQAVA
jgi:hypothetical protein